MSGTGKLLWEFVPDRRNLPPVLRSLIRQPVQQVWLDGDDLIFHGLRVHDTYPNRDLKGRQAFRERRPRDRSLPISLDEVIRLSVYPVRCGRVAGTGSYSARAVFVAVDLQLVGDARTVATVDRRLGTQPENERALAEALDTVAVDRWAGEPPDDAFCEIDSERLATWR
jgi:hypothetical protein